MAMVRTALLALIWALAGPLLAQTVTSNTAFGTFMGNVTGANKTTVGFGSNGTAIVTGGVPSSGAPDGGAGFKVSGGGSFRNPAGNPLPVTAAGRVGNADAAKALGRFFGRVAGTTFAVVGYAVATKQLLDELGITFKGAKPDGSLDLSSVGPGWTLSQNYGGLSSNGADCNTVIFKANVSAAGLAGDAMAQWNKCGAGLNTFSQTSLTGGAPGQPATLSVHVTAVQANPDGSHNQGDFSVTLVYSATAIPDHPMTPQDVADMVAARSGWPTSSHIAEAAAEAKAEIAGMPGATAEDVAPFNVVAPFAAGPATSDGTSTTQVSNNPDGSQRTEQVKCQYQHAYSGADVSTTEVCTTTVTNDGTSGKVSTSTVTKDSPTTVATPGTQAPASPSSTASAPTTAACGIAGKPACNVLVDETSVPAPETLDPQAEADRVNKDLKDFATDPKSKLPVFPVLSWAFRLPTGCTAISLGDAYAPYLTEINICAYIDVFHDIMSVIWVMGGLFGAIGTFWRSTFSAN